jgi:hypothetical protein
VQHSALAFVDGRQQHPGAQQFQQKPGRGSSAHLDKPAVRDFSEPGETARAQGLSLSGHRRELILRGVDQAVAGGLRGDPQ